MSTPCPRRLAAGLVLLSSLPFLESAAPPNDAPLREKGLVRAGNAYVLAAEAEVQKKLNAARGLYRAASAAAVERAQYEQDVADAKTAMAEVEQQLLQINQSLARPLPADEHNQLVAMNNALTLRLNQMRRQSSEETRQGVDGRAATGRESFLQAVLDLRLLVDQTDRRYRELAADKDVEDTIKSLNAARPPKSAFTFGPSRSYLANVAALQKVEAAVLTEDVPVRKEGGLSWVDVTFNGKVTRPMVFDTGASVVVLPSDLAAEIGLKPGPSDPVATVRVADGSDVPARRMVVPSMRVGKFTIPNVECIVMPPDRRQVAPLLGQTFQRNFSIRYNASAGKLTLSRLDDPEPKPATGKTKATTKRRR